MQLTLKPSTPNNEWGVDLNTIVQSDPIDRSNISGNVITVDLFHPDLYKIDKELALWAHFILTGDNPGKNIYMDSILVAMSKLDKIEKEVHDYCQMKYHGFKIFTIIETILSIINTHTHTHTHSYILLYYKYI